jgi:hypothetical protein
MTVSNIKLIDSAQITDVITILATEPTESQGSRITAFNLTNLDTINVSYDLHLVKSGDSPDDTNKLISSRILTANGSEQPSELQNQFLGPGDTIQAKSSVTLKINVRSSAIRFT